MLKVWYVLNIYLQYKLHHFQNRSDCFNTAFTTSTEPLGNPIDCPWPPEVHFVSKSLLFHRDHFSQKAARALSWAAGMQPLVTHCYQFSLKCAIYFISFLHNSYQLSTCQLLVDYFLTTCRLPINYILTTFWLPTNSYQLPSYQHTMDSIFTIEPLFDFYMHYIARKSSSRQLQRLLLTKIDDIFRD